METSTAQGEAPRRVSANEIDYASFVLYVKKGNAACDLLRALAAKSHDVIIQDVEQIQGPRPGWLRGVPSLVRLSDYQLFTGTGSIQELKRHLTSGIHGISNDFSAPRAAAGGNAALLEDFDSDVPSTVRGFDLRIGNDERYADPPKDKNAGGLNLEHMLRKRSEHAKPQAQQLT